MNQYERCPRGKVATVLTLLLAGSGCGLLGPDSSITGTWRSAITFETGGTYDWTFVLTEDGGGVSGRYSTHLRSDPNFGPARSFGDVAGDFTDPPTLEIRFDWWSEPAGGGERATFRCWILVQVAASGARAEGTLECAEWPKSSRPRPVTLLKEG